MTGTVDTCNVDAAKTRRASDQTSLYDYDDGEETFVGIVHRPSTELERVCDQLDDRLAPSRSLFSDWINKRNELRDEMTYVNAHNRAFDTVNYRKRFLQDLDMAVVDEYSERVLDGENIVLVCYCSNGCYCHRKIVKGLIHEELEDG